MQSSSVLTRLLIQDVLTDFNWIKLSDIPVLTQTTEFEALYPLSAPLLDFIESIDLSLLWTFNPESLSDAQKVSLGATLKSNQSAFGLYISIN